MTALLGLLALLMGFTFLLAADGYQTRRVAVVEEANAIGTAYLRVQLLPEPHRSRLMALLSAYTDNRIRLATARRDQLASLLTTNGHLTDQLWSATETAFPTFQSSPFVVSLLDAINEVLNLDTARRAARLARVPSEVFDVLLVYFFGTAGLLGYVLAGYRVRAAGALLLVLTGVTFLVILDVDDPTRGGITELQQPMLTLRASFHRPAGP